MRISSIRFIHVIPNLCHNVQIIVFALTLYVMLYENFALLSV